MSSLQSKLFLFLLRNRHLLQFRLKPKPIFETDMSIEDFRRTVDKTSGLFGKAPEGIEIKPITIGDMYAEWIQPDATQNPQTILYFHGGGYVSGTCETHHPHVTKVVQRSGIRALLFGYRLAPEQPYPAALEDSISAYQYLLDEGIEPENIVFMGDSAGGGLTLATLLALKDQGYPLPSGAVALSPWTDLTCSGDSYLSNAETCLSPANSWTVFSKYYAGDHDPALPWISPLHGNLEGLPPIRLYVGTDEVMRDDSIAFAEKAKSSGVAVSLTLGEGLFHCYPIMAPLFPEATQAMDEISAFIRRQSGLVENVKIEALAI